MWLVQYYAVQGVHATLMCTRWHSKVGVSLGLMFPREVMGKKAYQSPPVAVWRAACSDGIPFGHPTEGKSRSILPDSYIDNVETLRSMPLEALL